MWVEFKSTAKFVPRVFPTGFHFLASPDYSTKPNIAQNKVFIFFINTLSNIYSTMLCSSISKQSRQLLTCIIFL
jgi:hypothetical protein